jgi:D-ribose pyranose/furanose isomerase RbsD
MTEVKSINPEITTEEIMLTPEVKEEVKEAPSKLRQKLHELEAKWERTSIQFFQAPKL